MGQIDRPRTISFKEQQDPFPPEDARQEMARLLDKDQGTSSDTIAKTSLDDGKKQGRFKRTFLHYEDWLYLALLGIVMALCSLCIDICIEQLQRLHFYIFDQVETMDWIISYIVWVSYVVFLVCGSAFWLFKNDSLVFLCSGIPEMKVVLRGNVLKEYLSFRTLLSKTVGLALALGSGLPIGKEGPFVHVASIVANILSKRLHKQEGAFDNESRSIELLSAGCAVGVACTFSAPIGGVLFSIEVTSAYFAVRNYWRGFFGASCSALFFAILRTFRKTYAGDQIMRASSVSVRAHFQTKFPIVDSYVVFDLALFAVVGLICGLFGALYIYVHRKFTLFMKGNKVFAAMFKKHYLLYPAIVAILISSISYPFGAGSYLGGEIRLTEALQHFFSECVMTSDWNATNACPQEIGAAWIGERGEKNLFVSLFVFQIAYFILSIIASTLPVPTGVFIPVFVIGAAFGRSTGELLNIYVPQYFGEAEFSQIRPGIYAVVGAAAFCGAVTHTVSIAVIVFELTGQLALLLPVVVAVQVAYCVSSYFGLSIYDSIINIRRLPYLPNIPHSSSTFHSVFVEQFMVSPVLFVAKDWTYRDLQDLLVENPKIRAFPLVDGKESRMLLGSVHRNEFEKLLENKVGMKARRAEALKRVKEALNNVEQRMNVPNVERKMSNRFTILPTDDLKTSVDFEVIPTKPSFPKEMFQDNNQTITGFPMGKKRVNTEDSHVPSHDFYHTAHGILRSITKPFNKPRRPHGPPEGEFELTGDDKREWEKKILSKTIDISSCHIDEAPFQIVKHTSLFKVHSLFSLLGLNRAYVIHRGTLVGVVALKELREAVELVMVGITPVQRETLNRGDSTPPENEDDECSFIQPRLEVLTVGRPGAVNDSSARLHAQDIFPSSEKEKEEVCPV